MTKQVLLGIKGLQFLDDDMSEPVEVLTTAEYSEHEGTRYLRYEEPLEESSDIIRNTIRISPNLVEVIRRGPLSTYMIFEKGVEHAAQYETPYGDLQVGILAHRVDITEGPYDMEVNLAYALRLQDEYLSDCRVTFHVRSKDAPNFSLEL